MDMFSFVVLGSSHPKYEPYRSPAPQPAAKTPAEQEEPPPAFGKEEPKPEAKEEPKPEAKEESKPEAKEEPKPEPVLVEVGVTRVEGSGEVILTGGLFLS